MAVEKHEVIVLGSGPAGGIVARMCHEAGLDVVVVERNGWGGACPLRGCEPKKTLADMAHAVLQVRDMSGHGVAGPTDLVWPVLMRYKRSVIDPISNAVLESLQSKGIKTVHGMARFIDSNQIDVAGYGKLEGRLVVIAVGAMPRKLDVPGAELLSISDQFLELEALPKSLLFIGGGFISFEFACIAAAAGADVMILHRSEQVLKGFDPDLSRSLVQAMQKQGVKIHTNHPVIAVERADQGVCVVTQTQNGEQRFTADMAVLGAGRIPALEGLGLDAAGVEVSPRGVKVNEQMQSVSNPQVFAAGDCAEPGLPLTPVAVLQAEVVARSIIHGGSTASNLRGAAGVVFTHPPLASVGLLEEQAKEQGIAFMVHAGDAAQWSEHKRLGIDFAGYKVLVEKGTERILGAHYLGQHAEEVANIFGLAIRHGLTRSDLLNQPWAYPSFGYALRYMLR